MLIQHHQGFFYFHYTHQARLTEERRSPKPNIGVRLLGLVPSGRGGTGRRASFRSWWAQARAGSNPAAPTNDYSQAVGLCEGYSRAQHNRIAILDRWRSGLSCPVANRVSPARLRGFESRPIRQGSSPRVRGTRFLRYPQARKNLFACRRALRCVRAIDRKTSRFFGL